MTPGTVRDCCRIIKRPDEAFDTSTAKVVATSRADCILCRFVANDTNQDILPSFGMFLENEIWMICDLTHLHNETEDVGIIVEHYTSSNVGLELAVGVGHDAAGKVMFLDAKELIVDPNVLGRKLHGCSVITLHPSKHEAICQELELIKCLLSRSSMAMCLDWVQELMIENGDMMESTVRTFVAPFGLIVQGPVQLFARTCLAHVASKWLDFEESQQREEFSYPVL
jgi:hypothetical protein